MTIAASGVFKQIRIDPETTYNTAPAASDTAAYQLRRASCDLNPEIRTFKSNEIRVDRQLVTYRHGTQQPKGTLRGELSPKSYKDIFASMLAGSWVAGVSSTINTASTTLTYAAAVANTSAGTITRSSGSWLTDGFKLGDIINMTGTTPSSNSARYCRITGLTATVMSVGPTPATGSTAGNETIAAGTQSSGTVVVSVVGKKLITPDPAAGGTLLDPSFSLEQYFSDQNIYELYTGCKPTSVRLSFPPSGLATFEAQFMGAGFSTGSGQYFTAAGAAATTDANTGVTGTVRVGNTDIAVVTNLQLTISGGHTSEPVIGSVYVPNVFPGTIDISGTLSLLYIDATYFNLVTNETETDLFLRLNTPYNTLNADFVNFFASRVKLNTIARDDGPKAVVGTYSFQMLRQSAGGAGTNLDNTTLMIQDSLA